MPEEACVNSETPRFPAALRQTWLQIRAILDRSDGVWAATLSSRRPEGAKEREGQNSQKGQPVRPNQSRAVAPFGE